MTLTDMTHFIEMLPVFFGKVRNGLSLTELAELEASMPNICTCADVPKIFSALDSNSNGKIELREFSEWFIAGSMRSAEKQVSVQGADPFLSASPLFQYYNSLL